MSDASIPSNEFGSAPTTEAKSLTSDETNMAIIAHIGQLFVSFIAPLLVLLLKGETSAYVKKQSTEALNFAITAAIAITVAAISMIILVGLLLVPIVAVWMVVMPIVAAVKTSKGADYRYPLTIRLVK